MKAARASVAPKRPLRRTRVSVPRRGRRHSRLSWGTELDGATYAAAGGHAPGRRRCRGAVRAERAAQGRRRGGEVEGRGHRHGRSGRKGGRAWSVLLRAALGLGLAPTRIGGPPRPGSRRLAGSEPARGRRAGIAPTEIRNILTESRGHESGLHAASSPSKPVTRAPPPRSAGATRVLFFGCRHVRADWHALLRQAPSIPPLTFPLAVLSHPRHSARCYARWRPEYRRPPRSPAVTRRVRPRASSLPARSSASTSAAWGSVSSGRADRFPKG